MLYGSPAFLGFRT